MRNMKRSHSVRFMLTKAEKDAFMRLARERHTAISELIRQLLHRELETPKQQAAD